MTNFKIFVVALMLGASLPAGAWPTAPDAAAQVDALIRSGLSGLAVERAALSRDVPPALVAEAKLRAALERADRREVERLLASQATSPLTYLARAVLALERGQLIQTEALATAGMDLLKDAPARPLWELAFVRANAMMRLGRIANAVKMLADLPGGRDALPWSPYMTLLNMSDLEDPDRPRLVRMALQDDSYHPEGRIHAIRLALLHGDTDAMDRQFFEHAKLRHKRIARFQPRRGRRFLGLPYTPVYGPVNPSSKAAVFNEFSRVAIWRDLPGQARMAQALGTRTGEFPEDARWLSARTELEFSEYEKARALLEPMARTGRLATPEIATVQAWTGDAKGALATLERVSRQRADEPVPRLARLRALVDVDPAAAKQALDEEAAALGLDAEYWAIAMLAAHRRKDAPALERAFRQLLILRRMGRVNEISCFKIGNQLKELGRKGLVRELLRPGGRDAMKSDFDARPLGFSALVYRLLADRASVAGDTKAALDFLARATDSMEAAVLGRLRASLADLEPALRGYLPRLAYDTAYPIAQVLARVHLQAGDPPAAIRALNVFLPHGEPLSSAWFLLSASALGQLGQRDRINSMIAAGTILGARVGIPWGAFAQLLLVTGSDEGLHALARAARSLQDAGDDLDDLVALFGLGGLYADALQTSASNPGRGTDLGRGLAYAALGRVAEARTALSAAASMPGAWAPPALCALADLEYRGGNLPGCQAALDQLVKLKVDDYRVNIVRAMIALLQRDLAAAEQHADRAIVRGPHAAVNYSVRAAIARARNERERPHLAEAVRVSPHDARAWDELGQERLRTGDDPRMNLRECARQAVDAGQLGRAAAALALLPPAPLPPRPRHPYTDPRALRAAFESLLTQGPPALRTDLAGQDLAREGALQLLELGDDAGAAALVQAAIAREPAALAPGMVVRPPDPLGRNRAAFVMLAVLLLGPVLAGRGLRACAARTTSR